MKRFFFRPFYDLTDAFLPLKRIFAPNYRYKYYKNPLSASSFEKLQKKDPHELFYQFFKQNQLKDETEKEFFSKYFPKEKQEKFDPYKVLEISNDASTEQVKQAYRKLAIKYHPKNNTAADAEAKFAQISKAYQTIIQSINAKNTDIIGFKSFFEDFEKQVDSIFGPKTTSQAAQHLETQKQVKEGVKNQNQYDELYSESSSYQSVNGQHTNFKTEKVYKRDDKLIKACREEKLKDDGNIQITQTIDNGQQVKRKKFIQQKGIKKKIIAV